MARNAGIANQAAGILRQRPDGVTLSEFRAALKKRGRGDILPHSLRAAIYQRMGPGEAPRFERVRRARYRLRDDS